MEELRKTTQTILPLNKDRSRSDKYDIYPVHSIGDGRIFVGYDTLARAICAEKRIIVDGYSQALFPSFCAGLNRELKKMGVQAMWWDVSTAFKPQSEIERMTAPFIGGDDPLFGTRATLEMTDFFDADLLARIRPDESAAVNILYGCGASCAGWEGTTIYIDLPKNELQFRARAGSVTNLGFRRPDSPKKMYKRFYFIDWIVLNRLKKALLPHMDYIVDGQRPEMPVWAEGEVIRQGLSHLGRTPFRVRPWFEPGAWGGQWIKEHIPTLPQDATNYAWSFELIVPENGLIFESSGRMLEVSFDMLMFQAGREVVGEACYAAYGDEFPIRMDFLDNFDGGNLSIQCHPHKKYAQQNFGEVLTQEETYYILDCKDNAVVYLGFQENIVPEEFQQALLTSHQDNTPLDVERYVNALPSRKHGLYLIPPGTLHSSGRNNLVLEISTTPYIFTFKMYDWLARDLDGMPRPLNIARGMANLCFDRKGAKVEQELVSKPCLIEETSEWSLYHLPTHPNHSYDVMRYHIKGSVVVETRGKCHVLNLVEGVQAEIESESGERRTIHYAETVVVPAGCPRYRLINRSGREIMVVVAFMK